MFLLNEEALKNLQEIQFGAGQGEEDEQPDDYSVPDDADMGEGDEPAPADEEGTDEGGGDTTTDDTEDTETEDTGEEEPAEDEDTGDDYTMDEEPTDDGEGDEGIEEDTGEEPPADDTETTEEEDPTASASDMAKKKRLLSLYKKFYNDLVSLSTNIGERIAPLNNREEYLYKIIVENIEKNKKLLYEYIETLYNGKGYEENIYQFYYFSSQVEMIHILLRKIKTYRDNLKNNIIKK